MNYRLIIRLISKVMQFEVVFLILPLIVSIIYKEDIRPFVYTILFLGIGSFALRIIKSSSNNLRSRDGFMAVSLSWITISFFGALPFYFSGYFNTLIDCVFESISGFTTTGASILTQVENLPKGILFWRSFSHWIGGMGVLVFMLAIMPSIGASTVNLLKAESPGPSPSKIVPKIRQTALIMYIIYFFMTIANIILLKIAGLSLYDSLIHAFGSAGTGGFSNMNASIGSYHNVYVEIITTIFMFLFGINFTLYFYLLKKDFKSFFMDEELIFYTSIVVISTIIITFNIAPIYNSILEGLRHASFQVSTIVTTTGYSSIDFDLWPSLSKAILVILMFTGCSAGSTGGGIKMIRFLVALKAIKIEVYKLIHPKVVKTVKINNKAVDNETLTKIFLFFFIYFIIFTAAILLISIDSKDLVTNFTAVAATLSNIGPGLSIVGPTGNFSSYSQFSKIILSFCMLAGRLEFLPILILFVPSVWKRGSIN